MKQKLLKTMMLALVILGGASAAWAEKFSPVADVFFRTSLKDATYSWAGGGYPKTAETVGNGNMAGNYRVGMFVLQKYTVENLNDVNSLVLHLQKYEGGNGGDAIAVWAYSTNEWSNKSDAATIATAVNSIVGLDLNTTGTPTNTPLVNGGSNEADSKFTFDAAALQAIKDAATYEGTTGTFTLLLTNKTGDMSNGSSGDRKFYGSGNATEAYRPYIVATYSNAAEMNGVGYATLNAAINAAPTDGTETTITLNHDITITDRCNVTSDGRKVTVVPAKAGITISSTLNNKILLLCNSGGTLTIGCDEYELTIDGSNVTNSSNHVEASGGKTTIKNVRFRNCVTSSTMGVVCHKSGGEIHLLDVTFQDCSTTQSGRGIVFAGSTGLHLEGSITFENCNEYNFYQENGKYLNVGYIGSSQVAPFTTYYQNAALGNILLSSSSNVDRSGLFKLMNDGMGIMFNNATHPTDHYITEAYDMTVSDAKAATLVLPYEAKIPEGITAYTLNYTAGNSSVKATQVATATLPANRPVLLNAEAGTYKFTNVAKVTEATVGSGPVEFGALTGVYKETTVPSGSYILYNGTDGIGFYGVDGSTNKVAAYRAYLTADGAGVNALTVDFDNETGISETMKNTENEKKNNAVFDLSGRRVSKATKGLYIVNGKKYLVK